MKRLILGAFLALCAVYVHAEQLDLQNDSKEAVCRVWTKNAMYGASQR